MSNPIYNNIIGAPFSWKAKVRVTKLIDETGDESFLGKTGIVDYYEYGCGCGQVYPESPMIGVKFEDGRIEEFWPEELNPTEHCTELLTIAVQLD